MSFPGKQHRATTGPEAADPFHALIATTPDAVVTINDRGFIVFANPATEKLFGHPVAELIGQPLTTLMPERFRISHQIGLARYRVTREKHLNWGEIRLPGKHRDGHEIPLSISFGEYEANGQRYFTGIMRDMTAATEQAQRLEEQTRALERANIRLQQAIERLRETHEEAVAARESAEKANSAKSEFLTTMSHELRTPLNAIGGYAELLTLGVHGALNANQADAVERILRNEKHLLGLINDVLGFAAMEAGRVEMQIEDVPVAPLVHSLDDIVHPLVRAKGLAYRIQPGSPQATARADPEKLRQILINLVSNAIKFTEHGRITTSWRVHSTTVVIRVSDTGPGIPAAKLDTIFEPFTTLRPELSSGGRAGIGLGLAISHDLASAMGGQLTADSVEGEGATFSVILPRGARQAKTVRAVRGSTAKRSN
jgi:PAS domain S-box-containing protein